MKKEDLIPTDKNKIPKGGRTILKPISKIWPKVVWENPADII